MEEFVKENIPFEINKALDKIVTNKFTKQIKLELDETHFAEQIEAIKT
jgi:hypothetical protein